MTQFDKSVGRAERSAFRNSIPESTASADATATFHAMLGTWREQLACPNRSACRGKCQTVARILKDQISG